VQTILDQTQWFSLTTSLTQHLFITTLTICFEKAKHNKSMVPRVSQIMSKTKTFPLNHNLTCADYGIYVATCVPCHEQHVGQTKNKISKRWLAQRSNWNRPNCKNDRNEEVALLPYYVLFHGNINKPATCEVYIATFVEQPKFDFLNNCEDKWYNQLVAQWCLGTNFQTFLVDFSKLNTNMIKM